MSSAFRNFILTLLLMLIVFGYAAYKLVPFMEDTLLAPVIGDVSETSEQVSEESSLPAEEPSEESSEPVSEIEYRNFSCFVFTKNSMGSVCSALYIDIDEKTQKYLVCRIPVTMYLDNSGKNVPIYNLLGASDDSYSVKKLSSVVGKDVDYYISVDASFFASLEQTVPGTFVELAYPIKYLDPVFEAIPESQRNEEHYIHLEIGRNPLTAQNAAHILDSVKAEGEIDFAFQQSMCLSVLKQLASADAFATDLITQKKLFDAVSTNIPYEKVAILSELFFAYSSYEQLYISYPTTYDYAYPDIPIPNWTEGIKAINNSLS